MRSLTVVFPCAFLLAASIPASAFQVNTITAESQRSKSVAFGGDGKVTIVWEDNHTGAGTAGQYFRRFDSDGIPVGTAIKVTDDHTSEPEVSAAPDGSFVITWDEREQLPGPDGSEILALRFNSLGVPVGTTVQVNTADTNVQRHPAIAHDSAGRFVVAWHSFLGSPGAYTGGIFGQRYDSSGAAVGGEFQINTNNAGSFEHSAAIAVLPPNDSFVVVWYGDVDDPEDPEGRNARAQMFDSSGAPIGGEFQINEAADGRQGRKIDVAADALGNFTVVYTSNTRTPPSAHLDDVLARRFDSTGTALGPEFQVNQARNATDPRIAMQSAGEFMVSYRTKDLDAYGVIGRYFDSSGAAVGKEFRLNSKAEGEQNRGRLAANGTDQFIAVWSSQCSGGSKKCDEDEDGDDEGVFARRWVTTAPSCPAIPEAGCLVAGKSSIRFSSAGGGKLLWKWGGGFDLGHVGTPAVDLTDYVMCVYQEDGGAPSLVMSAAVPGGGTCAGKPCWKSNPKGTKTKYKNKAGTPDGIQKVRFKTGEPGRARFLVRGSAPNLSVPLPIGSFSEVTAQLVTGHGDCWEAAFDSAEANSASIFRAKF